MNSTTVSISINASWLEGEALQRWAGILKRAFKRRFYVDEAAAVTLHRAETEHLIETNWPEAAKKLGLH